jgi:excisionase family DNA binding protein
MATTKPKAPKRVKAAEGTDRPKRGRPRKPDSRRSQRAELMNNHLLMNPKEVAAEIGVHFKTLYRMVVKGEFPAPLNLGHRTKRFRRADVEAWVETFKTGRKA